MRIAFFTILFFGLLTTAGAVYALSLPGISFTSQSFWRTQKVAPEAGEGPAPDVPVEIDTRPVKEHAALPPTVKTIYMSQCYASVPHLRKRLLTLADTTEVNSIIIDIKDYTGTIAFSPKDTQIMVGGTGCKVKDMEALIAEMHARGIYVIGRITVFQDPFLVSKKPEWAVKRVSNPEAVWKDYKGLGFIDVGAREYWDYVVRIARESHEVGFDELNFDYIRFPSDGNMKDALYTHSVNKEGESKKKAEHLERFFMHLTSELRKDYPSRYKHVQKKVMLLEYGEKKEELVPHTPILSADIFGMTTTNTDDLSIGQVLERTVPHFDFVAPMVYPSHYPPGFNGYANPNNNVYGVIKFSMDEAVKRLRAEETTVEGFTHTKAYETVPEPASGEVRVVSSTDKKPEQHMTKTIPKIRDGKQVYTKAVYPATKLRTWIQDFDYGGDYGPVEIRDQFKATYDAGLTSWMIWSPSNRYTLEALNKE